MKIAVISTTILPCPPAGYSGLEMVAWQCAKGLAAKGHQVLLIAPGDAPTPGFERHCTTIGESEPQAFSGYWQRLADMDAVIDHSWNKCAYQLKWEGKLKAPVLGVLHAPVHTMYGSPPPLPLPCMVAISEDQSIACLDHLRVPARVCHNGIELGLYRRQDVPRTDRYLFLGRISTIKGPQIAVDLARQLRFGLDLVGDDKITGEPDLAQRMQRLAVNNIRYHGGKSREETVGWYSQAKAMLHCNQLFREPFGLAPVEAQACGLPVIAFDNGAMRETIKHGETGFVVKSVDEMASLIKSDAVRSIRAEACRENASLFSVRAMCDKYELLCIEAVESGGW